MVRKTDKAPVASEEVQLPDSARDWSYAATGDKSPEQPAALADQVIEEDQPTISPEVSDFYSRYELALKAWVKTHGPRVPPPVYVDPIDGKLKWANREMRKKHADLKRRNRKRAP